MLGFGTYGRKTWQLDHFQSKQTFQFNWHISTTDVKQMLKAVIPPLKAVIWHLDAYFVFQSTSPVHDKFLCSKGIHSVSNLLFPSYSIFHEETRLNSCQSTNMHKGYWCVRCHLQPVTLLSPPQGLWLNVVHTCGNDRGFRLIFHKTSVSDGHLLV